MQRLIDSLQTTLGQSVIPGILAAVTILILGWFAAVIIKAIFKKALKLLKLNERMNVGARAKAVDVEGGIATGVFYIVLLVVLLAVFNALNLEIASAPIRAFLTQIFEFLPSLIAGLVLALIAWILATVVRTLIAKFLAQTGVDKKLSAAAGMKPMSESLGEVCYWFIVLLFLPAILGVFQLGGLLVPVQAMVDKLLGILPNVIGALVVGFVGWLVAKILGSIASNLLAAIGADRLGENVGLKSPTLSRLVGLVVYIFVLIPALVAALDTLRVEAISKPATEMLTAVMAAMPNIFAAGFILAIAYFLARIVASLISNLLSGINFDRLPGVLGFGEVFPKGMKPSTLVGQLIIFFTMLFASVEAANRIGFVQVSQLVATFIEFGGQIILGSVIIAIGLWLANIVHDSLRKGTGKFSTSVANLVRVIILGLVFAMGLRAMGLASDIVNLAFGLTLGSAAVAVALSFGLGGRDAAGKQMEAWLASFRKKD